MTYDEFYYFVYGLNVAIFICCLALCLLILSAMLMKKKEKRNKNYMQFLSSCLLALVFELITYSTEGVVSLIPVFFLANCITYAMILLSVISFFYFLLAFYQQKYGNRYRKHKSIVAVLGLLGLLIYASSIKTGWVFYINDQAVYEHGRYSFLAALPMIPLWITELYIILKNRKQAPHYETILFGFFRIMWVIAVFCDAVIGTALLFLVMLVFAGMIFLIIDLEQERLLHRKEREIISSEMNALRLQMNPHYIYNTLASIDGLIILDPDEARRLIGKFIKHLRSSYLDNIPEQILFSEELKNLAYYISVQQTRFPEIAVIYDIQVDCFLIPPLVIQPLVENAIVHGICGREDSKGTVTISSCETEKSWVIKISDDGIGYEVDGKEKKDGRQHIGLYNARKRLELISQGTLVIRSKPGTGTEAEIRIPKDCEYNRVTEDEYMESALFSASTIRQNLIWLKNILRERFR